jgi:threonine/homoserine/homoserine lactone efflux protein
MFLQFIPDSATLLVYSLTCIALFIIPGPDMSFCLTKTFSGGVRMGLIASLGILTGACIHTVLAAVEISALVAASPLAFTILKIFGALYLVFLAVQSVWKGSAITLGDTKKKNENPYTVFVQGMLIDVLNPKVILFFVSFLPQFIEPHDPYASSKLLFLGIYLIALDFPLALLLILCAGRYVAHMQERPKVMRALDYGFAGLFGTFAVKLLVL